MLTAVATRPPPVHHNVMWQGDIGWHAFPFNGEPETYDTSLFSAALNLTFAVRKSKRFCCVSSSK
jgi:hypothetical protein